jgi:hypothetical protein
MNETKSNISTKGEDLEYRVKRLLFHMGYYPQNNVILSTSALDGKREMITDLDVYGTYFHEDLQYKTVYADCKSGAKKPYEKILWLKGIRDLYSIDDILFVCKTPKPSVKELARKNNIRVLDISILSRIENSFKIDTNDWSGSWNKANDKIYLNNLSKMTSETNYYRSLSEYLKFVYWRNDIYDNLKKIIRAINVLASPQYIPLVDSEKINYKWVVLKLTDLFIFTIMKICGNLYFYSIEEIRTLIRTKLLSGNVNSKSTRSIMQDSFAYAMMLVQANYPNIPTNTIKPDFSYFEQVPDYYEPLMDLMERIITSPQKYNDLPRYANYCLYEFDLYNASYDNAILTHRFPFTYSDNSTALKLVLHFIVKELGGTNEFYQMLK